jgi:hypothetical protein
MEAARRDDSGGLLSRHLVPGDGAFTSLVLFGYVLLATLIAGAASAGAGLAILAIGLLTALSLDFVRWRTDEAKSRAEASRGPTETSAGPA